MFPEYFQFVIGWIHGCKTCGYRGPTAFYLSTLKNSLFALALIFYGCCPNYHKPRGLKQCTFILEARGPKPVPLGQGPGVGRTTPPLRLEGRILSLPPPAPSDDSFISLLVATSPISSNPSPPFSHHLLFHVFLSQNSLCHYKDTCDCVWGPPR
jgi:hypothetical protein